MTPLMQDPLVGPLAAMLGLGAATLWFIFLALTIWTLAWKALALWHAARNRQKIWFLVFLVVNTIGIVEIVYLVFFRKDKNALGDSALFGFKDIYRAGGKSSAAQ